MVTLDPELQALKANLIEMIDLTKDQLMKCLGAIEANDAKLTKEVKKKEERINNLELNIDKDCENILALHNPVASDLRFVLASLKISANLERIGDNSKSLASYLSKNIKNSNMTVLDNFSVNRMILVAISMLDDIREAILHENVEMAKKIAKQDDELDKNTKKALKVSTKLIKEDPKSSALILKTYTVIRRLERIGDYIKNIAEEVVFHLEAKVIKHRKPEKK
jgi:phosphate transport system protein